LQTRATYAYNAMGETLAALDFDGNPLKVEYDLRGRITAMQSEDMGRKEQLLSRRLLAASQYEKEREAFLNRYDKAGNRQRGRGKIFLRSSATVKIELAHIRNLEQVKQGE
jgi:YD repeat-containing protein